VIYSTGTGVLSDERMKFRRAIWHGHVIGGAGLHYAAVLGRGGPGLERTS